MSSPEEKEYDLGRPGGRRLYDRGGFATLASKLFLPAHWFVDQCRSHEGPAIREQEQRVADATGQAREIEKMVAGILAGPVRRVAYYSVVHAVYSVRIRHCIAHATGDV